MTVRDLTILGCSSQQPTRYRNHGAYLLRWNGEGFLFDPGEGTQRQFIFANIAPPAVTRIFISHFHGDHCLGLGSMLMRLNIDKVQHPVHCYYPASGKQYFDRLRFGTIYHDTLTVIEHPVSENGIVHDDGEFCIEAAFLSHSVDNVGWRITERSRRKFDRDKLRAHNVHGPQVRELEQAGSLVIDGQRVSLDEVSHLQPGESIAVIIDTLPCEAALHLAHNTRLSLIEATYAEEHRDLAGSHYHMTAQQAAEIARDAHAQHLILTHFSARYVDATPLLQEARAIFPNTDLAEDLKQLPLPRLPA